MKKQVVRTLCTPKKADARQFVVSDILELPVIKQPGGRQLDEAGALKVFQRNASFTSQPGCYVYGIRAAKGIKPVYVGKTEDQPLKKEALSPDKIGKINKAILKTRKGTPVVAFVVPAKKPGQPPKSLISEIEGVLIQYAYAKNPSIENDNGIFEPQWFIEGVINSKPGRRSKKAREFRSMVGIR